MKVVTWNVNGIRAREAQVEELLAREAPDLVCLQEIKAPAAKVPAPLRPPPGYHALWHGETAYSGVSLLVNEERVTAPPSFEHPPFDFETRAVTAEVAGVTVASLYVPNGGKDFEAKLRFLEALEGWVADAAAQGRPLLLCGDLNVTLGDADVHEKERRPGAIGQREDERALLGRILSHGLADVGRALDPDNRALFTWWPPWRGLRQKNVGWRIDYVVASAALARTATRCAVLPEFGTSDHAPVVAEFGEWG
ncbi:MAG: exodeoxyribonuclease III [Anaeromyxobacter sp.]|nr:exodeoxyribonuclease III [Anaeromyxobacter sp.]MBL0275258.1 exodeoxyribonuclease III [Anaeromyxobacter sp.]